MMSAENVDLDTAAVICASCGIAEVDEIKLTKCDDCDLVRYCSDKCQQDHRMQHKVMCKERAAELRDEILFRQPEGSHLGDCPICCLPLPLDLTKSSKMSCCSKTICRGCEIGNCRRHIQIGGKLDITCPFCRHPIPETKEEASKINLKRLEANDPVAIAEVGRRHCHEGDHDTAFEYLTKAAELGDANAHYHLSRLYEKGGVEKDEKKGLYHLEEAAIAGHPEARYNLACYEGEKGRCDRMVKHLIISASLGCDYSIEGMKLCYKEGKVSKEDFASVLRAHQAAVNETKSPQREEASKFRFE
eukprot:scaffold14195_cov155-Skeletonema_dohrnii-CCMP3373.AAC.8